MQSEINIGLVGHVDHGKTTLTKALSGVWTDRHSEEIKRGISIRLGYADCAFYKCPNCGEPECYSTSDVCPKCKSKTNMLRRVSFVDAPGHETLMAVMLSGASLMDGAVLVIAANEKCPQPQTAEHLIALEILGVKNIVIVQNKIDVVSKDAAQKNYDEIKKFVKGTCAENAPIIPVSANYGANVDVLIQAVEENVRTPKREENANPLMYIARSFDINLPGTTDLSRLEGGVIGGSVIRGRFKKGDKIDILPGIKKEGKRDYIPIQTIVTEIMGGNKKLESAGPGGLIGIKTLLDPSLTKGDGLLGEVAGIHGSMPEIRKALTLEVRLLQRVTGAAEETSVKPLAKGEQLILNVGTAMTVGTIVSPGSGSFDLKTPVCCDKGQLVAISRRFGTKWRLIGYGKVRS